MTEVRVIGAGLAGSEAAWQLAERGFAVRLSEMKPVKMTPAHHCTDFAELVCSNSLRGDRLENAVGLLKEELRRLGSLILQCADATRVEAGGCLAVDRYGFSGMVTERIRSHPNITVISEEVTEVPAGPVIIATGPLTSDAMSEAIGRYFGQTDYLHFFDAAAPLVTLESIDMTKAWYASRYDRGSADYINCAMTREEYQAFVRELAAAEEKEAQEIEAQIKKLLETSDVTPRPGGFIWSVTTSKIITSPMGGRVSPGGIGSTNHRGVDIGGVGTTSAALATKSGKVIIAKTVVYGSYGGSGYGNYVVLDHGGGYTTLYAHLSSVSVSVGDMVTQGDTVGITGSTGNSTGPHLHYEVMINGVNQNPLDYLPGYIARW